jgi:tetratricopeptide (TPR) repeat protein
MLETYRYAAGKLPVQFFVFQLTGSDVGFFLQNQSTYNFQDLKENEFHLISFLDPQGRIEFYCWALKTTSKVLLLTPIQIKEVAHVRLEKFLISEDVTIEEQGIQNWSFILGPKSSDYSVVDSFKGSLFEETAILGLNFQSAVPELNSSEIELWRSLNGWPSFSGQGFVPEIINNLRLYDLSVSQNKGCYPGQETVSKIATRRGAAYSPVLLETDKMQTPGSIHIFDKKIGDIESCHEWDGHFYASAKLLRDFRVSGMKINFSKDGNEISSVVRYYPLLPGSDLEKAQELYYAALEAFKVDDYLTSEKFLKYAIELDPKFADAYESLGVILGRLNRFPEAIELMDHLTQVDPSSVLAHTNKSLFLMKMGKIEEAEEQKSLATVKTFQKFGDEAKLKDLILKEKKAQEEEWAKRENMFKQVLEIDDEDTLANFGLGSIAVERQDWLPAINYLEKVIKADANYSVAYLALGKAYKGSGQKDKAATIWKEGILIAAKKGDLMPANSMQFELQQL